MDVEKLINVLEAFAQSTEEVMKFIAKQEKVVRQQMKLSGRVVTDEQMLAYCQDEFEQAIMTREPVIYEKFNTTEQATKRAWAKYRNNEAVAKLESRILGCAAAFEPREVELPSEDELLAMLSELVDRTTQVTQVLVADLAKKGVTPESNGFRFAFQKLFTQRSGKVEAEVLAKHKMNQEAYGRAMMEYQTTPKFLAAVAERKARQQRAFESMGLKF